MNPVISYGTKNTKQTELNIRMLLLLFSIEILTQFS